MKKHSRLSPEGASALSRDEMKKVVGGNNDNCLCTDILVEDGGLLPCYDLIASEWCSKQGTREECNTEPQQVCFDKRVGDACSYFSVGSQIVHGYCSQTAFAKCKYCYKGNPHY